MTLIIDSTLLLNRIDSIQANMNQLLIEHQIQSAKLDHISNITQSIVDGDSIHNEQMNTVVSQLQDISTNGIGINDVVSVISIPLILMLFAFAFPFIFDIINQINSKYKSKALNQLFEIHSSYRRFWRVTYVSLAYVFLLGAFYLLLPDVYQNTCSGVVSWISLIVALIYSLSVVLFIRYCIRFNKADNLVEFIEKAYRRDQKKMRLPIWKKLQHRIRQWSHRKNNDWLKAYKQALCLSWGWSENSPEELYKQRLIELCKYALKEHDITLFYSVMDGVDKIVDKEKHSLYKSFGKVDEELAEGAIHYNTKDFFLQVFAFYPTCPQDNNIEESLIWKLLYAYNKSRFINVVDILFLSQTLLVLCEQQQLLLLEKYIDRARYYFSFITNFPRIHYVKGLATSKRPVAESKERQNWNDLCNFHFLVFSYAISKEMYGLMNSLISNENYHDSYLFPESPSDILIRYARCKKELKDFGNFGHWKIEEIFGKKVIVDDCLGQFAMLLLLLTHDKEDRKTEEVSPEDISILQNQKEKLFVIAKNLQQDNRLSTLFEGIQSVDINTKYTDTLNSLTPSTNLVIQEVENEQPQIQKEKFEEQFRGFYLDLDRFIPKAFWEGNDEEKKNDIDLNECVLVMDKLYFMQSDEYEMRGLYFDYVDVFINRLVYVMLSAYGEMKIKDVSITTADFSHYIDAITQNHPEDFLIIDVDSHIRGWIDLVYDAEFKSYYKGIPYLSVESVGRFNLLTDLPVYDNFRDTILILPKTNQPCLSNKEEDGTPKFSYVDESSGEEKKLSLRVGVDLGKKMVYNPEGTIVRIRIKKMSI